jgi:hypothetical protein
LLVFLSSIRFSHTHGLENQNTIYTLIGDLTPGCYVQDKSYI